MLWLFVCLRKRKTSKEVPHINDNNTWRNKIQMDENDKQISDKKEEKSGSKL